MLSKKKILVYLVISVIFVNIGGSKLLYAQSSVTLNNFANDYAIDGFVSVWYNNQTDHQYISVKFDQTSLRIITGVRLIYRTANILSPMDDCNVSYKFESDEYVYYNDILTNTGGNNQTHAFYCTGDIFLMTNTSFYTDVGCASDDPFIQVGFDNDHSGHSLYSLNGGTWIPDEVEYLIEAIVEDILPLEHNINTTGIITISTDFVDGYKISLASGDTCHFYLKSQTSGEYFDLRLFSIETKLTSEGNAIWIENGSTEMKERQFDPVAGDYVLLVEPHTDEVDNGTYELYWTYDPNPPELNALPPIDSDGNIWLSWNASPDTDLAYYNVYRGTSRDVPITPSNRVSIPGNVTGTAFEDRSWLPDGQYYYLVTAVDNNGHESEKSNIVNVTVLDSTAPLSPILDLPQDFPIDNDGIIDLNWSAPIDMDVQLFKLYRAEYSGFPLNTSFLITTINSTTYQDFAFLNRTYFYRVTAVDEKNLESSESNEVQTAVIDTLDPAPPANLTYQRNETLIILNWSASMSPDVDYYYIYRAVDPILDSSSYILLANTSDTFWIDSVPPAGKYYYVIIAVDFNGRRSVESNAITITVAKHFKFTPLLLIIFIFALFAVATAYMRYDSRKNPSNPFYRIYKKIFEKIVCTFKQGEVDSFEVPIKPANLSLFTIAKATMYRGANFFERHRFQFKSFIKQELHTFWVKLKTIFSKIRGKTEKNRIISDKQSP